jgi:ribosomal protein S12 methylthiotransferase
MNRKRIYHLISLGCAKNTVDSESMASILEKAGYTGTDRPAKADVIIVNTCGFIQAAREESSRVLKEMASQKKADQTLIAAGCYTERVRQTLVEEIPGIDGILSTRRWMDILDVIQETKKTRPANHAVYHFPEANTIGKDEHGILRAAIQGKSAYLKIADGCRRPCAFCSIPLIKGSLVSRPLETIIHEAFKLQEMGILELLLIAQDTTDYGFDLGLKDGLSVLLNEMGKVVKDIPWIRILYTYPGYVTDRLIDIMANSKQILPYFDIPLQHAHPDTLRRMKRPSDMDWVHGTIKKIRSAIPNLALRSTFIVGYPGETESEFQTLLDFISEVKFDHIGAFTFSFEPGTASEPLGDPIPGDVKEDRLARLMKLQETISLENNQRLIGKTLQVLIEGVGDGISVGRSYRDAPEIDGLVIIEQEAPVGTLIPIQVTGAMTHDLVGHLIPAR